jgi:hypothetical protein
MYVQTEILTRIDTVKAEADALRARLDAFDPVTVEQAVVEKVKALKIGVVGS